MELQGSDGSEFQIRTVLLIDERLLKSRSVAFSRLEACYDGLWTDLVSLDGFKRVGVVFSERNTCLFFDLKKNRMSRYSCQ